MQDCRTLTPDCLEPIISFTSPLDACRWSVVSRSFNSVAKSNGVWVKFLRSDYRNLVPASLSTLSLKDLYLSLCDHPVLIEDGRKVVLIIGSFQFLTQQGLSLHKRSGQKCYMLAARDLAITWGDTPHYWGWNSIQDSRFPESAELLDAYLVFKLAAGVYGFTNEPIKVTVQLSRTEGLQRTVFLHAEDEDVQNDYQYPIERGDGWLELELGEFFIEGGEDGQLEIRIFHFNGSWKSGVIIEGIEIRPN
ncbi:hypothetical protein SLE2022_057680 [Rubroshorea leprosula]